MKRMIRIYEENDRMINIRHFNEIISNFWWTSEISERERQKGLQYAFEAYIHDIICNRLENNFLKIEVKA